MKQISNRKDRGRPKKKGKKIKWGRREGKEGRELETKGKGKEGKGRDDSTAKIAKLRRNGE